MSRMAGASSQLKNRMQRLLLNEQEMPGTSGIRTLLVCIQDSDFDNFQ
jgi:hypothetical protein